MTNEAKTERSDAGQPSRASESAARPEERLGISRRGFIAGASAAGAAAGLAGFPAIHVRAQESGPIKFGLLEDRSGNFALFGTPKYHATQLAIKEINEGKTLRSGPTGPGGKGTPQGYDDTDEILVNSGEKGVLGRQIELVAPDPQSENRVFQQLARRLILEDKVDVLMGGFASAEREAIRPIMDQTKQLYFYNNQYEGGVADKYTFCTGAVAEQQIIPAMEYMVANFGNKIYTPAADYNFGQLSAMWTRAFAPVLNAKVVGEEFIPLSVSDFTSTIARIQNAKPDWLMMYITGQNHSNYYPQANAAGVHYPMGSSINMAQGYEHKQFAPPALAGMHVAVNYMEEIPTARNQAFVKRFHEMFPDEPYISQQSQNAYNATHLYAAAVRLAKTTNQAAVIEALEFGDRPRGARGLGVHGSCDAPPQSLHPHRPGRERPLDHLRAGVAAHRALVAQAARG